MARLFGAKSDSLLGFPGESVVKNPPEIQEMRAQFLGREDPLEEEMAAQSSILAWRIPWTEGPGGLQSMGSQRVRHDWATNHHRLPELLWETCAAVPGVPIVVGEALEMGHLLP